MLEAEVVEINRDVEYCEQCLRKYGEWFNSPLQYLRVACLWLDLPCARTTSRVWLPCFQELKRTKKNKMCTPPHDNASCHLSRVSQLPGPYHPTPASVTFPAAVPLYTNSPWPLPLPRPIPSYPIQSSIRCPILT